MSAALQLPQAVSAAVAPNLRLRPKDAASLVLVDRSDGRTRFLMGVRAASLAFMPGHLVFPGGRLDPGDLRLAADFEIDAHARTRLTAVTNAAFSDKRATALALAAIRETQEETGFLLGSTGAFDCRAPGWRIFAQNGVRPAPERLVPLARAITPPGLPRRFDARFFLAEMAGTAEYDRPIEPPTAELECVRWIDVAALSDHRIAPITRTVIDAALQRLSEGTERDASRPMPFYRRRLGRSTCEFL